MDVRLILAVFALFFLLALVFTAPVDQNKDHKSGNDGEHLSDDQLENKLEGEIDDLVSDIDKISLIR